MTTVANTVKKVGQYTLYTGIGATFVMAVIGTIAIDLVFYAALNKQAREGQTINFLCTLYAWHCFSGSGNNNPFLLLLLSPVTTSVAIALSIVYDVSFVGMYLAGGWAIAVAMVLLGYALFKLGQWLNDEYSTKKSVSTLPVNSNFTSHRQTIFYSEASKSRPLAQNPYFEEDAESIYDQEGNILFDPTIAPVEAEAYPENPYLAMFG